jgi:hypothetical protein
MTAMVWAAVFFDFFSRQILALQFFCCVSRQNLSSTASPFSLPVRQIFFVLDVLYVK